MAKKGLIILSIIATVGTAGLGAWQFYFKDNTSFGRDELNTAYVTKVSSLTGESMGSQNWYAGVVEAQNTVKVNIESGRKVSEVAVEVGQTVKEGDLLFEYNLSSIEDDLKQKQLDLDKLINEAQSYAENIATLEVEKTKAKENQQLSYTIEIETARMNLKQNEYNQIKKQAEIDRLLASLTDTRVVASVDGVIQKIDSSKLTSDDGSSLSDELDSGDDDFDDSSSSDNSFITILGTGNYRVKGYINEQNRSDLSVGEPLIIRSRADSSQTWSGTLNNIDEQNAKSNNSDSFFGDSGDSQTNSSSYPFYVQLDNSDNLMLGQHVYIEKDVGQTSRADGLWLFESFVADADTESPYVWAAGDDGKLEKRYVILGQYDDLNYEYQILDGLSDSDSIAEPDAELEEGMPTADSSLRPVEEDDYSEYDDYEMYGDSIEDMGDYSFGDEEIIEGDWDESAEDWEDWDIEYDDSDFEDPVMMDEFDMDFENEGFVFDSDDEMSAG